MKPKAFESPEQLMEYFEQYVEETKSNPIKVKDWVGKDAVEVYREKERPLTAEGFDNWLYKKGIIYSLRNYNANSRGAYDDYSTVCSRIKEMIRQDQIEGGMASIYNPSITQRLNGLADKKEHDIKGALNIPQLPDIADRK